MTEVVELHSASAGKNRITQIIENIEGALSKIYIQRCVQFWKIIHFKKILQSVI